MFKAKLARFVAPLCVVALCAAVPATTAGAAPITPHGIGGSLPPNIDIYTAAPIASTGHGLVTADFDLSGDLLYWWQATGSTVWHEQLVASGFGASWGVTPSIVWTGSAVDIAASVPGGDIYVWSQPNGGTGWTPEFVSASPIGTVYTSLSQSPGGTVLTAGDGQGDVLYWWQDGGGAWHQQLVQNVVGNLTFSDPVITSNSTGNVIAAVGSNGDLYSWYQPYGRATWLVDEVDTTVGQWEGPLSIASAGSQVTVVGDAYPSYFYWEDSAIEVATQPAPGIHWSVQSLPNPNPGDLFSAPEVAWTGFNFVVAADEYGNPYSEWPQTVDFWWQDGSGAFHPEVVATSPGDDGDVEMAVGNNAVTLTVPESVPVGGSDMNGLYTYTQGFGARGWNEGVIVM